MLLPFLLSSQSSLPSSSFCNRQCWFSNEDENRREDPSLTSRVYFIAVTDYSTFWTETTRDWNILTKRRKVTESTKWRRTFDRKKETDSLMSMLVPRTTGSKDKNVWRSSSMTTVDVFLRIVKKRKTHLDDIFKNRSWNFSAESHSKKKKWITDEDKQSLKMLKELLDCKQVMQE